MAAKKPEHQIKWIMHPLPHISYGWYGGYKYGCKSNAGPGEPCPLPVDLMDNVFLQHDIDSGKRKPEAEWTLFKNLFTKANPVTTRFAYPVYGRLYWLGALVYSGVSMPFSAPIRYFMNKRK